MSTPPRKPPSTAGIFAAVLLAVLAAALAIGAYAKSHQQVSEYDCNTVLQTCTVTNLPVGQTP